MKNANNKHLNTLNNEIAAREAEAKRIADAEAAVEAKAANEAIVIEIIAREEAHADEPKNGIFETVKLFQEGKRFNVKLQVLAREPLEGEDLSNIEVIEAPIGCATREDDVQAMIDDLRPYAPKGRLLTMSDIRAAMMGRMHADQTAADIVEAGENPEKKFVVDGVEYFSTNGIEIRRAEDSKLITTLKSLPRLIEEDYEELVFPAIREAVAKMAADHTAHHTEPTNTENCDRYLLEIRYSDGSAETKYFDSEEAAYDEGYSYEDSRSVAGFEVLDTKTGEVLDDVDFE